MQRPRPNPLGKLFEVEQRAAAHGHSRKAPRHARRARLGLRCASICTRSDVATPSLARLAGIAGQYNASRSRRLVGGVHIEQDGAQRWRECKPASGQTVMRTSATPRKTLLV